MHVTRACEDNAPFFVTFEDVTTAGGEVRGGCKGASRPITPATGDQQRRKTEARNGFRRPSDCLRMHHNGRPLSMNDRRIQRACRLVGGIVGQLISNAPPGWADPAAAEARLRVLVSVRQPPRAALPFLMFGNLLRELSWLCLILRSALAGGRSRGTL